jgi:hypothetical protein
MISFTTSQTLEINAEDLSFSVPPNMVSQVTIERNHELASTARAIFKASPEVAQKSREAEAPSQNEMMDIRSLPDTIHSIRRKPVDIAFNGGKIHNIHFSCDNIRNISFNGGNVRNISFGPTRYSDVEEDKVPKPSMPQRDLPPLSQPHSLTIQVPPNQKSIDHLKLQGRTIVLQAPEDLVIGKLNVITFIGQSGLGAMRAGRASLRMEGGTMEAGQMRCDDFKAVVQAGCLRAPTARRSSIMVMSGVLRVRISESATAQLDIVVNAGKAYVEVPTIFEGELNCDVSGGRVLRDGKTLPNSYRQRAVNNR